MSEDFYNKIIEKLQAVKKLLTPEKSWIKRTEARTKPGGLSVDAEDKTATCFCLMGAVNAVTKYEHNKDYGIRRDMFKLLAEEIAERPLKEPEWPESVIATWNDKRSRTQQEVLDLVGRTIKKFKKEKKKVVRA